MVRTPGIIYKISSYQEYSKLVFIYTPEGKKTLIAKGCQMIINPYRIWIEYLNLIEFENKQNSLFLVLNKAFLLNNYKNIKKDYINIKKASLILELIDKTIDSHDNHLPHDVIFQEVLKALQFIQTGYLSFALRLLNFLGYKINFNSLLLKSKIIIDVQSDFNLKENNNLSDVQIKKLSLLRSSYDIQEIKEKLPILNFIYYYYEFYLDIKLQNLY
ncbi:recombinational DNA repair protein O [Candidatus Phytoplasma mali]|uniref:Recombinational DNA repair protein O n=2 Tax=Apple proliferation phytoplasma TaxID=37692 RepID=B3QZV3_PHYMT|nr:recombinational DNA repair protein O [Candidatus Phytoplasma mali]